MADDAAWRAAKADPARSQGLRGALAAFQAAGKLLAQGEEPAEDWEVLLAQARCMRKLEQPAAEWLPLLASVCRAAAADGGALLPLYKLHAARMRLLLSMPSARRWADAAGAQRAAGRSARRSEAGAGPAEEHELLRLVGRYCFLPLAAKEVASQEEASSAAAEAGDAAAAMPDLQEEWRRLLADCVAAMQWVQDKDRNFHRAAHR